MNDESRSPEQVMSGWMAQVTCCMIRGVIALFPQFQVEKVLLLLAAVMGQQMAQTYAGDEVSVFRFRKACRDAFGQGISSLPVAKLDEAVRRATSTASIEVG